MTNRQFMSFSIEALEKLFDDNRNSRDMLQSIAAELLHRGSRRASELAVRVQQAVAVLPREPDLTEPDTWDELAARITEAERSLILRSPLTLPPSDTQHLALWPLALELGRYDCHMMVPRLRAMLAKGLDLHANSDAYGLALKLGAFELRNGTIVGWPGFALLMRRMLGDDVIPWLPSLFLAAAALPGMPHVNFDYDEARLFTGDE